MVLKREQETPCGKERGGSVENPGDVLRAIPSDISVAGSAFYRRHTSHSMSPFLYSFLNSTPSLHAFARPAPARSLALLLLSPPSSSSLSAADMQLVNPSGAKATPHGVLSSPIASSHPSSLSASCLVLSDSGAVVEITLTQGKFVQRLVAPPSSPSLSLAFRAGPYVLREEENQGPGVEVFRVVDGQSVGRVTLGGRRSLRGLWGGMRGGWREEEKEGKESDLLVLTVDKAETLVLQTMDDRLGTGDECGGKGGGRRGQGRKEERELVEKRGTGSSFLGPRVSP